MEDKIEIEIYTECFFTLSGLKDLIKDIREIEKEHNCNCTLINVKIIDKNSFKTKKINVNQIEI